LPDLQDVRIDRADAEDFGAVLALLERCRLPPDGLQAHLPWLLVARQGDSIVGSAALEVYSTGALLRSVAVDPEAQGHGLGQSLTEAALGLARGVGVPAVYLLTTTAERFFPRFGFTRIVREEVPDEVRTSVEFTSACPASAVVMRRSLPAPLPVACSLPSDELAARREALLPGLMKRAIDRREVGGGFRYSFEPSGDILPVIARVIDAERQCCRFLRFQVTVEPANGPIAVEITGPSGTREFLSDLVPDRES
jgi:amino-acid N-acetyltransferase